LSPEEFLRSIQTREPAPAYLFIGAEAYDRDRCRRALTERLLPPEDREEGLIRHDLDRETLSQVLDDAQSFSLFARVRLIWVSGAEAAMPRGRTAATTDEDGEPVGKSAGPSLLVHYMNNPTPGTVLVFECSRYELEGDDKARVQRVQKFYSAITAQVEFARYSPEAARRLAAAMAKEVLSGDASRIANEIEKLALYAGAERTVTEEDIWNLTPNAKASTIFALVNALGRRDRVASLESLDVLVREGEYLPLALSFLATQFRLALVAREARLTNVSQVQAFFTKQGAPMWRSRAEQVTAAAGAFSADRLRQALLRIYETDKALRDVRPDDRIVMEKLVLELTAA
jgi:DNA polymerase III subunit delta